jgi:hypothetical protein
MLNQAFLPEIVLLAQTQEDPSDVSILSKLTQKTLKEVTWRRKKEGLILRIALLPQPSWE